MVRRRIPSVEYNRSQLKFIALFCLKWKNITHAIAGLPCNGARDSLELTHLLWGSEEIILTSSFATCWGRHRWGPIPRIRSAVQFYDVPRSICEVLCFDLYNLGSRLLTRLLRFRSPSYLQIIIIGEYLVVLKIITRFIMSWYYSTSPHLLQWK